MAWTQEDLSEIRSAKKQLALGKQVVRVSIEGDLVEYKPSDYSTVCALEAEMVAELSPVTSNYFLTTTSKGL